MATQVVNGLTSYVTSTSGTITYYIPINALTTEEVNFLATADANATTNATTVETELKALTFSNGQNGWTRFEGYVQSFDSTSNDAIISGSNVPAAGTAYSQTEEQTLVDTVNAIKNAYNSQRKKISG